MNNNKYPSSCKSLAQKWHEQSLKYKYYSSNEVGQCRVVSGSYPLVMTTFHALWFSVDEEAQCGFVVL
jgi:mannosyltransferase OCH1-like enzyme